MTEETVSAHAYQMAQLRISQLELENKTLKDKLKLYEQKHGVLSATPPPQTVAEDSMAIDTVQEDALSEMREKIMKEREAASTRFLALLGNYQKLVTTEPEPMDEHLSTEESFSMPSALNTQDSMAYLDSTSSTPLNTE